MKLHFIAICGTGMGSVAGLLQLAGHEVRGSDEHVYPPMSTQLEKLGIDVMHGFSPSNLDWNPDLVVVGNVCRKDHVEAVAAQERGIPLTSFPAVLEEQFLKDRHAVVVAGTHGKTTCSSLLSWLLADTGRDPSFFIGGIPQNFGQSFRLGKGPHFVLEGDEYDTAFFDKESKFLHYRPRSVLFTGVEFDHADIFDDLDSILRSFDRFLRQVPPDGNILVWSGCDPAVSLARGVAEDFRRVETYGVQDDPVVEGLPSWHARVTSRDPHGTWLEVRRNGERFVRLRTTLTGMYNLRNLVGCVALCHNLGLGSEELHQAVMGFRGVKRRQEVRGVAMGVTVIDDFAHHPTAVRETLAGLRAAYGGRLFALFEPRSATSRRAVFQEQFATAFDAADEVIIGAPYDQSRIAETDRLDPEQLVADLRERNLRAGYIPSVTEIVDTVTNRVRPGDVVVVMSSGSFENLHRRLLAEIGDAVMPAETDDLRLLQRLMERVELPTEHLADHLDEYIVLRGRHGLAGAIGLERHGHAGLLKDLVVVPERRGEGLSWLLAEAAVKDAARRGITELYMFGIPETMRTGKNLGFSAVECTELDESIRTSETVRSAWYSKAGSCLRLSLTDDE